METTSAFELKSINDAGLIEGLAAAVGNVDHGGDRLMAGAFQKSLGALAGRPLPMLLYHDLKRPIGAWTDLRETPEGLVAKGKIATDTRDGAEAHTLARAGALTGLSIGFVTEQKSFVGDVRELHQVALHEISLTPIGLNDRAVVRSVKSIASVGDLRDTFRELGFSTREAKAMAGAAWRARDDDDDSDETVAIHDILTNSTARLEALSKGKQSWK